MGRLPNRVGRVGGIFDSGTGSRPAYSGADQGVFFCEEAVGAKSEALGAVLPPVVSNPVKFDRAGRFAKMEIGCGFFSGAGGRAGRFAKCEVGVLFFSREEECADSTIF